MTALWVVTEEIVSDAIGGAFEANNPLLFGLWQGTTEATALGLHTVLNTSALPVGHSYRLYVFVREVPEGGSEAEGDSVREASASLPFRICHDAVAGEECHSRVRYAMQVGVRMHPRTYLGVNASSSFQEFQMMLHQKGEGACPMPCSLEEWCHTTVPGEECHTHVGWAMREGLHETLEMYPTLQKTSSFKQFQMVLHKNQRGICTRPCPPEW